MNVWTVQVMPLMEEVERQLEELDEEDKKREVERNRQKIHKAFMSRPVKTVVPSRFTISFLLLRLVSPFLRKNGGHFFRNALTNALTAMQMF